MGPGIQTSWHARHVLPTPVLSHACLQASGKENKGGSSDWAGAMVPWRAEDVAEVRRPVSPGMLQSHRTPLTKHKSKDKIENFKLTATGN